MSSTYDFVQYARSLGYSEEELRGVPEGLVCHGCGNPIALAELQEGENVLDLGCGGGLDAFLAAQRVGPTGHVIGVDSSAEAVARAAEAASKGGYAHVVFKAGAWKTCLWRTNPSMWPSAIASSTMRLTKLVVFKELIRCLRPGGRLVLTDLVAEGPFSQAALDDEVWGEWLGVALGKQEYLRGIREAGFKNLKLVRETTFPMAEQDERLRGKIVSIGVKAYK